MLFTSDPIEHGSKSSKDKPKVKENREKTEIIV
jgi:hypothetical protein